MALLKSESIRLFQRRTRVMRTARWGHQSESEQAKDEERQEAELAITAL